LSIAEDAVHIDTTGMPIEQVVNRVMELVNRRFNARG
jgi:cytidylate kinase